MQNNKRRAKSKKKFITYKKKQRFQDVDYLIKRIESEAPKSGDYLYDYKLLAIKNEIKNMNQQEIRQKYKIDFADLPISRLTQQGLKTQHFIKMTEIQRCVIPHALAGRDILGASKTGSGKTLTYLLPAIERLYTLKWSPFDKLGALIIVPTRELGMQVFQVYSSITELHELSVGLIIGGKDLEEEKQQIANMNILICTPGRLLQHMNETPEFETDNLKVLVIDEADTLLDLGFANTMNQIIKSLPTDRQTMLFSATLSHDVQKLVKLSLKRPEHVLLHVKQSEKGDEKGKVEISNLYETPIKLDQYYMTINVEDKIDTLFSFLKTHVKSKILVFFSSRKQCRFIFETFKKLRIGLPIYELHGGKKQEQRTNTFFEIREKKSCVLLTTNVSARGLDIPQIDWIVQFDCPEDIETYVHRIGRTARYKAKGKSLLFLTPSEAKFTTYLSQKNIKVNKLAANPSRQLTIKSTLSSYATENIDIKYLAQRAFVSYMKSVFYAQDKNIFDVNKLNAENLAESFGLIQTPIIKFVSKTDDTNANEKIKELEEGQKKQKVSKLDKLKKKIKEKKELKLQQQEKENIKNSRKKQNQDENNDEQEELPQKWKNYEKQKAQEISNKKLREKMNKTVYTDKFKKLREDKEEDEDELFTIKKRDDEIEFKRPELQVSKRQLKKIKLDGHFNGLNKTKFDEEGNPLSKQEIFMKQYEKNLEKIEKENKDFAKDYGRKLVYNKEIDDQEELLRRKQRKKKIKQQKQELLQNKTQQFQKTQVVLDNDMEDEEEEDEEEQE